MQLALPSVFAGVFVCGILVGSAAHKVIHHRHHGGAAAGVAAERGSIAGYSPCGDWLPSSVLFPPESPYFSGGGPGAVPVLIPVGPNSAIPADEPSTAELLLVPVMTVFWLKGLR